MLDRVADEQRRLFSVAVEKLFLDVVEVLADCVELRMAQYRFKIRRAAVPDVLRASGVQPRIGNSSLLGALRRLEKLRRYALCQRIYIRGVCERERGNGCYQPDGESFLLNPRSPPFPAAPA